MRYSSIAVSIILALTVFTIGPCAAFSSGCLSPLFSQDAGPLLQTWMEPDLHLGRVPLITGTPDAISHEAPPRAAQDKSSPDDSLLSGILRVFIYSLAELRQLLPFWAIGLVAGSVIAVFGKAKITGYISRFQGTGFGILGIIPAALLGIASPVCMYGTIPVAAALAQEKVPESWLAAFMMSSILLNPQLFLLSFALGPTVALIRFTFCVLGGICAGLLVHFFFRNSSFFTFSEFGEDSCRDIDPDMRIRLAKNIYRAVVITAPYLLLGILLAAVYMVYFPQDLIISLFGGGSASGVVLATALGIPIYICGGGVIPLLKAWLDSGMSVGSATAFMLSGPATKITNISAIKIILGSRNFVCYLAFVMAFSIGSGLLIDTIGVRLLS